MSKRQEIELKDLLERRDKYILSLESMLNEERTERIRLRHCVKCMEPEILNCQCPQACDGFND